MWSEKGVFDEQKSFSLINKLMIFHNTLYYFDTWLSCEFSLGASNKNNIPWVTVPIARNQQHELLQRMCNAKSIWVKDWIRQIRTHARRQTNTQIYIFPPRCFLFVCSFRVTIRPFCLLQSMKTKATPLI
jgi:hypothetical protein